MPGNQLLSVLLARGVSGGLQTSLMTWSNIGVTQSPQVGQRHEISRVQRLHSTATVFPLPSSCFSGDGGKIDGLIGRWQRQ
jgi:hypothetical protein